MTLNYVTLNKITPYKEKFIYLLLIFNLLTMKKILLLLALGVILSTQILFAQVPSYVPTNGLRCWWPFNGNANDESGNGFNGTVVNATLTSDRFGLVNNAYHFNGIEANSNAASIIQNNSIFNIGQPEYTISLWFKTDNNTQVTRCLFNTIQHTGVAISYNDNNAPGYIVYNIGPANAFWTNLYMHGPTNNYIPNQWYFVTLVKSNLVYSIYINGVLEHSYTNSAAANYNYDVQYRLSGIGSSDVQTFAGDIDDFGLWNRALTQQEITNLYNSISSNECLTMTINTGVLGTTPVTYTNTVNIYPNPANDQITIDCGNLANVVGWNIKITNMLGQEVFNQPMNTQQYVVPLNSWTGQGMYFVKIINAQNEVVNIKKIILQ
jgi:hypothetical protein